MRGRTCGAAPAALMILVEGFEPDALAVARLLAAEGAHVRIAGPGDATPEARALDVEIQARADLDADPGEADVAYLDVWTPETSPRVSRLRAGGTRLTCASELVLERARAAGALTIGVTGTAGKTTTAVFAAQLLRRAGRTVHASGSGRLGNLWATDELIEGLGAVASGDVVVLELTSSHLAFMETSPALAVMTCFWPDHVELHGSVGAYRAAKETIVRHQSAGDTVVVNADDEGAAAFATLTPASRTAWSRTRPVEAGVFVRDGVVVARRDGAETVLGRSPESPVVAAAALGACATALAAGTSPGALEDAIDELVAPPHRRQSLGRVAGVEVVDDGMATTPAKARAALAELADRSVVLIAGGRLTTEGGPVHASPEERHLLRICCDEIGRAACAVVLFGEAAGMLESELRERGIPTDVVADMRGAVPAGFAASPGADVLLFAPIFPVPRDERLAFAALIAEAAAAPRVRDSRP